MDIHHTRRLLETSQESSEPQGSSLGLGPKKHRSSIVVTVYRIPVGDIELKSGRKEYDMTSEKIGIRKKSLCGRNKFQKPVRSSSS